MTLVREGGGRPLQNRVTPFGEIVATEHRGNLMGNRGCLHDDERRIIRKSANRAWISCTAQWPGIRRQLMTPGWYTELFFLDEATAMAAGHRPCHSCRPERLKTFKQAWARAYGLSDLPKTAVMDAELRRTPETADRSEMAAENFPDGAIGCRPQSSGAWLRWQNEWYRWSFAGYEKGAGCPAPRLVPLTPSPMMAVLSEGYVPEVAID